MNYLKKEGKMAKVVVSDDVPSILYLFKEFFKLKGFEVAVFSLGNHRVDFYRMWQVRIFHVFTLPLVG